MASLKTCSIFVSWTMALTHLYFCSAALDEVEHPISIDDCENICKIVKREYRDIFFNELNTLTEITSMIKQRADCEDLFNRLCCQLVGFNRELGILVYGSQGKEITEEDLIVNMNQAFKCLKVLRELKIVHRDIQLRHFVENESKKLMLIDFGFAVKSDTTVTICDSAHFAPMSVLANPHLPKRIMILLACLILFSSSAT